MQTGFLLITQNNCLTEDLANFLTSIPFIKQINKIEMSSIFLWSIHFHLLQTFNEILPNSKLVWELSIQGKRTDEFLIAELMNEATFVFQGKSWNFETIFKTDRFTWSIIEIDTKAKMNSFVVLKISRFRGIKLKFNPFKDNNDIQDVVDQLKEITESSNDIYMITKKENVSLILNEKNLCDYKIEFDQYKSIRFIFQKHSNIDLWGKWMINLPKHLEFEFWMANNLKVENLNKILINFREFENSYILFGNFEIRIIKTEDNLNQSIYHLTYVKKNISSLEMNLINYEELKKLIEIPNIKESEV